MIVHRAAWVVPIAGPVIRDGWVGVEAGRIVASGSGARPPASRRRRLSTTGRCAILPALVNAHTHLELSYMRGLVPPAASFDAWVQALISLRGRYPDPLAGDIIHAIRHAIAEARAAGTGVDRRYQQHPGHRSHAARPRHARARVSRGAGLQGDRRHRNGGGRAAADRCRRAGRTCCPHEPRSARALLGIAGAAHCRSPGRCRTPSPASTSGSRRRRRTSCCTAAGPFRRRWSRWARGIRRGRRPAAGRWSTSRSSACSPSVCWPSMAFSSPTANSRSWPRLAPRW